MKKSILFYLRLVLLAVAAFFLTFACQSGGKNADDELPILSGPYLGQKPPGTQPEIFAPGIVSTGHGERCPAFSPDGKEMFYCIYGAPFSVFVHMKEINGRWTKPRVAPFSGRYPGEMTISPDGNTIVFSSNEPYENSPSINDYWTWIVKREGSGWGKPEPLGRAVNSEGYAGYPYLSNSGNLYFFSNHESGRGGADIYISEWKDGQYQEAQILDDSINSNLDEVDPAVAPDESYIIFSRRKDDGVLDLFISFRKEDGYWTEAKNMGEKINSDASDYCPIISADAKYIFFTSKRSLFPSFSETPLTFAEKIRILNSPGNGDADIYWVDARIIEDYRNDHDTVK